MAVRATHVAFGDLCFDDLLAPGLRDALYDAEAFFGRIAVVKLQNNGIRLAAVHAWVSLQVGQDHGPMSLSSFLVGGGGLLLYLLLVALVVSPLVIRFIGRHALLTACLILTRPPPNPH